MSGVPFTTISSSLIDRLVLALESLTDGELAVDMLIASGERAIAPLEELLLQGKARTIAVARCRAVRALGELQARGTLLAYFEKCDLPADPVVLFAEDAVRSAVALELMRWREDEVFQTLLRAAKQRATVVLIESLGEFCRSEAIPLLFETLEDDLCRNAAFAALCKTPAQTRGYAILSLAGKGRRQSHRRGGLASTARHGRAISQARDFPRGMARRIQVAERRGSHGGCRCCCGGLSRGSSRGVSGHRPSPIPGCAQTQLAPGRRGHWFA